MPLKTYLPDGDIDLTAFSTNQNLKDSWANLVRDMLEKEEKNENAEFHVKEVQYIQAEVIPLYPNDVASPLSCILGLVYVSILDCVLRFCGYNVSGEVN